MQSITCTRRVIHPLLITMELDFTAAVPARLGSSAIGEESVCEKLKLQQAQVTGAQKCDHFNLLTFFRADLIQSDQLEAVLGF